MALNARASKSILLPYQLKWVNDHSPLKIWLAARQIGKSFALSMEAVTEALEARCNNLILSSSQRQSREVMQKVFQHLRVMRVLSDDIIKAEHESKEEVQLPNSSRIISLPSSPATVRGFSGNVFLDEFAFHDDTREIWRAMYPTVTRGYKIRITSTPNGKQNMFYDIYEHNGQFSKHRTDIYEAVADGLDVDPAKLRDGIKDPDAWAQEYECAFMDEVSAYITYEMIAACESDLATVDLPKGFKPEGELYLGVDVGRKKDLTVFWLWEKVGDVFWARMVKEMLRTPFSVQREFLYKLLGETGIRRACIDASGIGMQLAEEARTRFGPRVEPVTFTNPVKEDLAVTFRRGFEDLRLRVPKNVEVREDLHSVKRIVTAAGNTRFDAERSEQGHADRFWAGALGVHAGTTSGPPAASASSEKQKSDYHAERPRGLSRLFGFGRGRRRAA